MRAIIRSGASALLQSDRCPLSFCNFAQRCTSHRIRPGQLRASRPNPEKPHQADYEVEACLKAYDKAVFGVYASKHEDKENIHSIYTSGDGNILVTNEGGDIEIGDYLTSSNREGHGMKQADDLLHSYTVAKALEAVDWEKEGSTAKLIACTYHAQ